MDDGVDAAVMEICAAAMFLVRASPSDLAIREEGVATVVVEMKAEVAMGNGCWVDVDG